MEIEIGKVVEYHEQINMAVLMLRGMLISGAKIHIQGRDTDFTQRVASMQIANVSVLWAQPGENVVVKVDAPVRQHDRVYRIVEEQQEPQAA